MCNSKRSTRELLRKRTASKINGALPLEVTIRGGKTTKVSSSCPYFCCCPSALLSLRFRAGTPDCWLPLLFIFAPYFLNIGTRFLIPSLPRFSLAICLSPEGSDRCSSRCSWCFMRGLPGPPILPTIPIPTSGWLQTAFPGKRALRIVHSGRLPKERYSMPSMARPECWKSTSPKASECWLDETDLAESYTTRDWYSQLSGQLHLNPSPIPSTCRWICRPPTHRASLR